MLPSSPGCDLLAGLLHHAQQQVPPPAQGGEGDGLPGHAADHIHLDQSVFSSGFLVSRCLDTWCCSRTLSSRIQAPLHLMMWVPGLGSTTNLTSV